MVLSFFNSPIWELIQQSDWVTKYIILLGLLVLSIYCIAIIFNRFQILKKTKLETQILKKEILTTKSLDQCYAMIKNKDLFGSCLINTALNESNNLITIKNDHLTSNDIDLLANILGQQSEQLIQELQMYLPILSSAAAASPLVGLFGTIWGLIHSFVRISQEKSADIATVAPGIAEALLTTLAGLIVAIPALVAFNYFTHELASIEHNLQAINEHMLNVIQKSQLLQKK